MSNPSRLLFLSRILIMWHFFLSLSRCLFRPLKHWTSMKLYLRPLLFWYVTRHMLVKSKPCGCVSLRHIRSPVFSHLVKLVLRATSPNKTFLESVSLWKWARASFTLNVTRFTTTHKMYLLFCIQIQTSCFCTFGSWSWICVLSCKRLYSMLPGNSQMAVYFI